MKAVAHSQVWGRGRRLSVLIASMLVVALPLGGCATLTVASIGTLLATGAISGIGSFTAQQIARGAWKKHIAWQRCRQFRNDPELLENCVRFYVTYSQRMAVRRR
jgi:hypothetical protein